MRNRAEVAAANQTPAPSLDRRLLGLETAVVVGLAVGLAALRSLLNFAASAVAPMPLRAQSAVLNRSLAPGHPWIDLGLQLVDVVGLLLPVALVLVLAARGREPLTRFGLHATRWRRDLALGLGAAALIGGSGLTLYLLGHALDASLTLVPTALPPVWWRIPVLVLSAVANAALEEVVLVGYLLRRLGQLGWATASAIALSAGIRGCYHVYQGVPGLLGNLVMGLLFAGYYRRTGRVGPLLVAHATIDTVAFLGYIALAGRVSWLPS